MAAGVGVVTSTDPVGPWSVPWRTTNLSEYAWTRYCPAPFDPGVCIDEEGTGWLSFGGGVAADRA